MQRKIAVSLALVVLLSLCLGSVSALSAGGNEALVILQGLPLWTEKSGAVLEFKEYLTIADKVALLGKQGKFKQDGKERDYVKVKSVSGNEGWVRASYVVSKASLAVVKTDKAIVYSEPRDVKMTAKWVSRMTIVAVLDEGSTSEFAKVLCYDAPQDAYYTDPIFVSRLDLSYLDADLNALILLASAKGTKDKGVRQNFLRLIESKYAATQFLDYIRATLNPDAAKPSAPATGSFLVNDDNVNVRATPDEVGGQVVAKLNKGAKVTILEATTQSYPIGSLNGPWYKIAEPAGWVYGPFLTPAN